MPLPAAVCSPSARPPRTLGIDLQKATVAIQGYGNAGYYAAKLAKEMFGCKVVAVCDSKGGDLQHEGHRPQKAVECKGKDRLGLQPAGRGEDHQ